MSERFSSFKENAKSVQVLCRLSLPSTGSVTSLKLSSGRCLTVLSTGNKLLHVIEKHKIHCIISLGCPVLKVLDYVDESDKIWVVTVDGKLRAIAVSQHQPNEQKSFSQSANHDIFAELLGEQDIPHSSDGEVPIVSPFSNVKTCPEDNIMYWEPGLQGVVVGTYYMITCASSDGGTRISVYPWVKQNDRKALASHFSYQTLLPKDASNHGSNDVSIMLYLAPSEQPSSKCANSTLCHQLFSLLFHSQSGVSFPVVLVGCQSGLISYIHVGTKSANLVTLYHLEQSVLSIFPVCLKSSLPAKGGDGNTIPGNALVILGALGKLVIMTQDTSNASPDGLLIREYHVPGPIVCAAVNTNLNKLIYSTRKEVCVVQLEPKESRDKTASSCPLPTSLSSTTLNVPKVLALDIETAEKPSSMVCLKSDGYVILAALSDGISDLCMQVSAVPSGQQIKRHLDEIQEKACNVQTLHDEIHQLNDLIKHLNNVTQVLCEILRSQESAIPSIFQESCHSRISFKVDVDYEAKGTTCNPSVILRCELLNSTKFSFSQNWSLVVQVATTQPWFNEAGSVKFSTSHSVPLSPASVHYISIPLEDSLSYLTPIQISCYVCFELKELLPVFLKDSHANLAEEGFTVLVSRQELSVLNFFRMQEKLTVLQSYKHPAHLLQSTLNSLNSELSEVPEETSQEFSMFSIYLSSEAVNFIQKVTKGGLSQASKSSQVKSEDRLLSPEACVLQFLLHASRRHLDFDNTKIPGSPVAVRTPKEGVVKFQVLNLAQGGSTSTAEGMEGLDLRVHTSSRTLGCAVHSAVLKVLERVLQRTPEEHATVPVGELQKQLIRLKELQMSLDLLRPSQSEGSIEELKTNDAIVQKLISIYCDLRKIPTVIP